jgi:uncharacterized membrane protein
MASVKWWLAVALALAGALAVLAGVLYFALEARSLPSILGALHSSGHRSLRGMIAIAIGVLLLAPAAWLLLYDLPASARR